MPDGRQEIDRFRPQYERALVTYASARSEHEQILHAFYAKTAARRDLAGPSLSKSQSRAARLQNHTRELHAQIHDDRLNVISEHIEQVRNLQVVEVSSTEPKSSPGGNHDFREDAAGTTTAQARLGQLLALSKQLTRNLEDAVIISRSTLKQEKARLEAVKARSVDSGIKTRNNDQAELAAIHAVRLELQRWIDEKLSQCDEVVATPDILAVQHDQSRPAENTGNSKNDLQQSQKQVEDKYNRYIQLRTKLFANTRTLQLPPRIEPIPSANQAAQDSPTNLSSSQPPPPLYSLHDSGLKTKSRDYPTNSKPHSRIPTNQPQPALTLSQIEQIHIPHHSQIKQLEAYTSALTCEVEKSNAHLLGKLQSLALESRLLDEYPLPTPAPHVQQQQTESGKETRDEIEQYLHAWSYASATAGKHLRDKVDRDRAEAEDAMQKTRRIVEEMQEFERLRQDVFGAEQGRGV